MKILLLHDVQAFKQNGVSVSLGILSRELSALGFDIKILTLSDDTNSFIEDNNYCLSSMPALIYPGIRLRPPVNHRYIKEIIEWEPDIIHTNCEFSTFLIARKIIRACNNTPKWVHTFHTDYKYYIGVLQKISTIRDGLVPRYLNYCFKKTNALIVPTEKMRKYVTAKEFAKSLNVKVIPTGIDFSELELEENVSPSETKSSLGIPIDAKVILFLGRISAEKNLEELITLFADYSKKHNNVYFVTVGDGPYKETLIKKVEKLGIESKCIIHDGVKHKEIRKFYDIADVFASASVSETQGLTFYEAMYCGAPVLAKDRECLEEAIIEGQNGAFFDDESNFESALDSIISLRSDSNGTNTKLPECFESKNFALSVASLYKEVSESNLNNSPKPQKMSTYRRLLEKGKRLKIKRKKNNN